MECILILKNKCKLCFITKQLFFELLYTKLFSKYPPMSEKYSVHDYTVEQILNFIKSDEIAIPEIQRPFVWKGWQVRDLVDSFSFVQKFGINLKTRIMLLVT